LQTYQPFAPTTRRYRVKRIALTVTVILVASFVVVVAKSSYLGSFNTLYGTDNKILDSCVTCHGGGYSLNSYAVDFNTKRIQLGSATAGLQAVETMDSDKDGDSNLAEIEALTFPGNPLSSLPVEATTWGQVKALFQ
jgi:hypothetical protein